MDIRILKNGAEIAGSYFKNNVILEKSESDSEFDGIKVTSYSLYNIDDDTRQEILPGIEKHNIGKIVNASLNNEYLYFTNIFKNKNGNGTVSLIRYNILNNTTESIFAFEDKIEEYQKTRRLKLFIINDLYLIIQKEYLTINADKTYTGFFQFELTLFNMKDQKAYDITDENLNKNGISDIIILSDSQCIIKTGFSLIKDNRYNELKKDEASLESVGFINISQMISDLMIGQGTINIEILDQAFYTKTIPYIKKSGDYLIYSCVNNETKSEEVRFYNIETADVKTCIHQDVIRYSDLAKPYIINNEPYICMTGNEEISFLNINTGKIDVKFDNGMILEKVFKDSVILSGITSKKLFQKSKAFYNLYSFPGKNILYSENSEYIDSIITENDIIYIIEK